MRYFVWTVGCQMNKSDSERFAAGLEGIGLAPAERIEQADVIVVNTCSVRQSAEDRTISKIGSLKPLKRTKPGLTVVLAGCMVPREPNGLRDQLPLVDAFVRPGDLDALLSAVRERLPVREAGRESAPRSSGDSVGGESPPANALDCPAPAHASSGPARWVTVMQGCNKVCSYCIVPYRRGPERSRPMDELLSEVKGLVAQGAKEVTLLGQIVDTYGRDLPGQPDLADLFALLNGVEGLERIRFLTSHPKDMSDRIIEAVARLPKVCEHINLPVQSGDDEILEKMRRGYTADEYTALVARVREFVPGVSIATDIIVGMPGETEAQFERTYDLVRDLRCDVVHVAAFSPRKGTLAARRPDDVPPEEKKRRLAMIEAAQERIASEINDALLGSTVEVLVEEQKKGKWGGRTRTNKLVFFTAVEGRGASRSAPTLDGASDWVGKLAMVRITKTSPWSLQGDLVSRN